MKKDETSEIGERNGMKIETINGREKKKENDTKTNKQ